MPRDIGLGHPSDPRRRRRRLLPFRLAAASPSSRPTTPQETPPPRRLEDGTWQMDLLSPVYPVDREYRSMTGPWSTRIGRSSARADELVWVLGYSATMAGPDGITSAPQEYMCHSNLDFDPTRPPADVRRHQKSLTSRLFTLSQGQLEIAFPEGFGMPLLGNEPLSLTTQVLNLNPTGEVGRRAPPREHPLREAGGARQADEAALHQGRLRSAAARRAGRLLRRRAAEGRHARSRAACRGRTRPRTSSPTRRAGSSPATGW